MITVEGKDITGNKNVMSYKQGRCGLVYAPKKWIGKQVKLILMED